MDPLVDNKIVDSSQYVYTAPGLKSHNLVVFCSVGFKLYEL